MTKTFTQISNETFDLSYGYHDNVVVLTGYRHNGDEETISFDISDVDDFYELCKTFCEVFKSEL